MNSCVRRMPVAGLAALLIACGDLEPSASIIRTGTMSGSVSGSFPSTWIAHRFAYAEIDGDSSIRIVGEDTLGRGVTLRLMGVDMKNPDAVRRQFVLTESTLFEQGFGEYSEATVSGIRTFSTARIGGTGSVTITTLTTARVAGSFGMTVVSSLLSDTATTNANRHANGSFDLQFRR